MYADVIVIENGSFDYESYESYESLSLREN